MIAGIAQKLNPVPPLETWLRERLRRKRGPQSLPFTLHYRNIYIVPTAFGFGFGAMLALTALGGLNFNNNLALLEVFILATAAVMTTFLAHRVLVRLELREITARPVFAGEDARFRVYVHNPEPRNRFSIRACSEQGHDSIDLPALKTRALILTQATETRGWLAMEPFRLESRFPLGLFRAWAWWFPTERCLVWPRPAENPPPLPRDGEDASGREQRGEGEELHSLREYRAGDSPRHIAWKTSARQDALYTREMATPRSEACELDWYRLNEQDPEKRLSILTAWVLEADRRGIRYRLRLPSAVTERTHGPRHRERCLRMLALAP